MLRWPSGAVIEQETLISMHRFSQRIYPGQTVGNLRIMLARSLSWPFTHVHVCSAGAQGASLDDHVLLEDISEDELLALTIVKDLPSEDYFCGVHTRCICDFGEGEVGCCAACGHGEDGGWVQWCCKCGNNGCCRCGDCGHACCSSRQCHK